jgi:hypothetical protein
MRNPLNNDIGETFLNIILLGALMLNEGYSANDLESLTDKAQTMWEYDFESTPKRIKRRSNVVGDKLPLRAIYRMVVNDWTKSEYNCFQFPFSNNSFSQVLGMNEDWDISVEDRKFIEKDMVLFASDHRTILISTEIPVRWWETTWFNVASLLLGVLGLLFGVFK